MNLKNIFLIILYFNKISFSYIIPKRINNQPQKQLHTQLQSEKKNYIYQFNLVEYKNDNNLIRYVLKNEEDDSDADQINIFDFI